MSVYVVGDVQGCFETLQRLLESFDFEVSAEAPHAVATKAMLRTLGLAVGHCRPPLGPTPDGLEATAAGVHDRLNAS